MDVEVTIAQGTFRGVRRADGVCAFLGMPYAAAPVGRLRFAAPEPPQPRRGTVDATRYGATVSGPAQRSAVIDRLLPDPVIAGRDPLNLNVWTGDTDGRAPVLVWIHGGGFVTGTGAVTAFDGGAFARAGVVTVVLNYRLAVEGFLQIDGTTANRGLLDQVAALEWVRDNIAAFGGDPGQVTVAGESAGAMSVLTLLAMPRARGLFRRAVAQSGDGHHVHTPEQAAVVTGELCTRLGVADSAEAIGAVPEGELHAGLNEVIGAISGGREERFRMLRRLVVQPVIDGDVLPRHPVAAFADGAGADVALLAGTNAEEYGLFTAPTGLVETLDETGLRAAVARLGVDPKPMIDRYRALRPGAGPAELFVALQDDWFCRVALVRAVEARLAAGADTHVYEFAWRPSTFGGRLGACHTLEVPFVFDTLADPWGAELRGTDAPRALAREMNGQWAAFVQGKDLPWRPYGAERVVRRFGAEPTTVLDPEPARRAAWNEVISCF